MRNNLVKIASVALLLCFFVYSFNNVEASSQLIGTIVTDAFQALHTIILSNLPLIDIVIP